MKKALFLDKAPSSVRVPLQMQNLDTFEAMTAVTLQFLQHNAQYQAGVTVTPSNRRGPDDMEIDPLTKQGKGYKGKGKRKTDGQKRRVASRADVLDTWPKIAGSRKRASVVPYPTTRASKAMAKAKEAHCERSHDTNRVDDDSTSGTLSQSNLENHPGRHLGPSRPHG